jgi:hypothetical protein
VSWETVGLREAAQRILDRVGDYYDNEPPSCGVGCSQCCDTSLTVGDLRALRAALERPRPAPPENHALTLAQTLTTKLADAVTRHVGCNTEIDALVGAIGDALEIAADRGGSAGTGAADDSPNSLQPRIAALRARNFQRINDPHAAGTGAAPPSEALTRSRIDHWLRNRGLQFYSANSNTRVGFGQTADAIIALMDDLAEYACGGAAQPPPSALEMRNDNLRSELEGVYRDYDFLRAEFDEYKRTHPGVPREETKP